MKKHLFFIVLLLSTLTPAKAQITFIFSADSYVANDYLKSTMEKNISKLLTQIDAAGRSGSLPELSKVNIQETAVERLYNLWGTMHMTLEDDYIAQPCLTDMQGFQVRNIGVEIVPQDGSYKGKLNREMTISLDKNGQITGVRLSLENQESMAKIMAEGNAVTDERQRREILKWVEDFRSYYNERNINALNQIFSEDALIITGSIVAPIKQNRSDIRLKEETQVRYTKQAKQQYISKLGRLFNDVKYINVDFDNISITRNGAHPDVYGVMLRQDWKSSIYCDNGWLFLMWDFSDEDRPLIHVRTWQPEKAVKKEQDIFNMGDFVIP